MHIVSFETAKRLAEAGFPQPEHPTFGQVFISGKSGKSFMFQEDTGRWEMLEIIKKYPERKLVEWNSVLAHRSVFAPTATDILKHLPGIALTCEGELWVVFEITTGAYRSDWQSNPAEAAAQAWLRKNAKP